MKTNPRDCMKRRLKSPLLGGEAWRLLMLVVSVCLLGASCQSKPKIKVDPVTGVKTVDLGNTWLKKSGIDYQKFTDTDGSVMESVVIDGDETVVPVKAADVYQVTELSRLALEGLKATTKNPNKIPKDPNTLPVDPNKAVVDPHQVVPPGNPNFVPPPGGVVE